MVSSYTQILGMEEPANGDYSGTWGSAVVNPNMVVVDGALGLVTAVDLTAGSVTLSTAAVRSAVLQFTGTLPSNVTVTVPAIGSGTIAGRIFSIQNNSLNSSLYTVVFQSTVAGARGVGLPYRETIDVVVLSNSGNVEFRSLDRVGAYWDYSGSSVPNWVSACTLPPYLLCDGSAFSSASYPALTLALGGTTLPDARGRSRFALNSGTGRITSGSSTGGVDGNTILASGGAQTVTLSSQNIPPVPIVDTHSHAITGVRAAVQNIAGFFTPNLATPWSSGSSNVFGQTNLSTIGSIVAGSTSPTNYSNMPPAYVGGIVMIRAA